MEKENVNEFIVRKLSERDEVSQQQLIYLQRLVVVGFALEYKTLMKKLNAQANDSGMWSYVPQVIVKQWNSSLLTEKEKDFVNQLDNVTLEQDVISTMKINKRLDIGNLYTQFHGFICYTSLELDLFGEREKLFDHYANYIESLDQLIVKEVKEQEQKVQSPRQLEIPKEKEEDQDEVLIRYTFWSGGQCQRELSTKKIEIVNRLFQDIADVKYSNTARFGRTATGIKAIRKLHSEWSLIDEQGRAESRIDQYFAKVHKIIQQRRSKNRLFFKRAQDVDDFYVNANIDMNKFHRETLLEKTMQVIRSDVENGAENVGAGALLFVEDYLSLSCPHSVRTTFYSNLMRQLNQDVIPDQKTLQQVQKMILVLKTNVDVTNPIRKKHSKLGRPTGVAEMKKQLDTPLKKLTDQFDPKGWLNNIETLWEKITELFEKIGQIVSSRLEKTMPTRREPTKKLYGRIECEYERITKIFGGPTSDLSEEILDENDNTQSAESDDKEASVLVQQGDSSLKVADVVRQLPH